MCQAAAPSICSAKVKVGGSWAEVSGVAGMVQCFNSDLVLKRMLLVFFMFALDNKAHLT